MRWHFSCVACLMATLVGSAAVAGIISCGGESNSSSDGAAGAFSTGGGSGGQSTGFGGSGTGGATSSGGSGGQATGGTGGIVVEPWSPPPLTPEPIDETATPGISLKIYTNHIGYDLRGSKRAVISATGPLSKFQLVRNGAPQGLTGTLAPITDFAEWASAPMPGSTFHVADFSAVQDAGTYRVLANGTYSEPFEIGEALLFDRTITDVLSYFRLSRADDTAVWNADQSVPFVGGRVGTADVRGGWYDASGDISKYLSHLSYANFINPQQIPLVAWALAWVKDSAGGLLTSRGLADDVEAEALWGADYLVRVQDPAGYFYINVFDRWTGELGQRQICAFQGSAGTKTADYQAAYREGGGVAIAALARVARWQKSGSFTAAQYLQAAETGFDHLEQNGPTYCDDGKENIIDDYTALLAASELFATTSDSKYLTAARSRATALAQRLTASGFFTADDGSRPFWHAADAGLPVVALVRYHEVETDMALKTATVSAISQHLSYLVNVTNEVPNPFGYGRQTYRVGSTIKNGFFIPRDNETNYWWQGESARLGSLAAAAVLGSRAVAPGTSGPYGATPRLGTYAANQVDWILGKNPYDICFMKGYGRNNPPGYSGEKDPYHEAYDGGIANGITSGTSDGSGIAWNQPEGSDVWLNWRWVEQWLPHSTWYMVAVTAMALEE